jgi:hypothetical protein
VSNKLVAGDLMSSETYAREQRGSHADAVAHREQRTVRVGPNVLLVFQDERTVRHYLQEMLRIEQTSGQAQVQAEIDACAGLIPDGSNFKATLQLEFADADERRAKAAQLSGIEQHVWMQVDGSARLYAIAEANADRAHPDRDPPAPTLRFELDKPRVRQLKSGSRLSVGIDHGAYHASLVLNEGVRQLLLKDLR